MSDSGIYDGFFHIYVYFSVIGFYIPMFLSLYVNVRSLDCDKSLY